MEDKKGKSILCDSVHLGKLGSLPLNDSYKSLPDSFSSSEPGSESPPELREAQHHRAYSDTAFLEDQPSWLDDLLTEPETPLYRGHQRSSSDSLALLGSAAKVLAQKENKFGRDIGSPVKPRNIDHQKDLWQSSLYTSSWFLDEQKSRPWESSPNAKSFSSGSQRSQGTSTFSRAVPLKSTFEQPLPLSKSVLKQNQKNKEISHARDANMKQDQDVPEMSTMRGNSQHAKPSACRTDSKRNKQQFAQRSRVRKLQYIAELERNVQILRAEGAKVSAEIEFLSQHNLLLGMENRALRDRLYSLSQEQLIKCFEHDTLEREIERLQFLYHQQQQQQQHFSTNFQPKFRDLSLQFANLSLKGQEPSF